MDLLLRVSEPEADVFAQDAGPELDTAAAALRAAVDLIRGGL